MHRDIKPDNFVLGPGKSPKTMYIIDYGLSKHFRDPITKVHIPYKDKKKLTGTGRYASLNSHLGIEQSRRDDLECLGYTMIYLLKGGLPWQGIRACNRLDKYEKILERKKGIPIDALCKGLPPVFAQYMQYCRSLNFDDKPDYAKLKKRFLDYFIKENMNKQFAFDWNKIDFDFQNYFEISISPKVANKRACAIKCVVEEQKVAENSKELSGSPNEPLQKQPSIMQRIIMQKLQNPPKVIIKRQNSAPHQQKQDFSFHEKSENQIPPNQYQKLQDTPAKMKGSSNYDSDDMDETNSKLY